MTEQEARDWIRDHFGVSRETQLESFVAMLIAAASSQNLIAASTISTIWSRHIVDSAQLALLAKDDGAGTGHWIDIGSGAGLPGLVIAILRDTAVSLVEPRRMRADFLQYCVDQLGLALKTEVAVARIEGFCPKHAPAAIVSARAVAPAHKIFASARHLADRSTLWLLPKGLNAQSEVDAAAKAWQGVFHVKQSVTDPESGIIVAREVRAR